MSLRKLLHNERGAITISDILIVLVSVIFIGAVAVPFMLGQQADMNKRTAALNARSVAVEVETFLLTHPNDTIPEPISIVHTGATQRLLIPLVTIDDPEEAQVPFTLSSGITLPTAEPGNTNLAAANVIYARDSYCIAVRSFGQVAFHNQDGPAENCALPDLESSAAQTVEISDGTESQSGGE